MVYIDPPYGVKFGSNFQPFVRKRDVTHGADDDLTREPFEGASLSYSRFPIHAVSLVARRQIGEQPVVEADFRGHGLRGRYPVDGRFRLAPVRRVAVARGGVVGAAHLGHLAVGEHLRLAGANIGG